MCGQFSAMSLDFGWTTEVIPKVIQMLNKSRVITNGHSNVAESGPSVSTPNFEAHDVTLETLPSLNEPTIVQSNA